jgi:hypothetical protein
VRGRSAEAERLAAEEAELKRQEEEEARKEAERAARRERERAKCVLLQGMPAWASSVASHDFT